MELSSEQKRSIERLYENESLTDNLTDDEAKAVLNWAQEQITANHSGELVTAAVSAANQSGEQGAQALLAQANVFLVQELNARGMNATRARDADAPMSMAGGSAAPGDTDAPMTIGSQVAAPRPGTLSVEGTASSPEPSASDAQEMYENLPAGKDAAIADASAPPLQASGAAAAQPTAQAPETKTEQPLLGARAGARIAKSTPKKSRSKTSRRKASRRKK